MWSLQETWARRILLGRSFPIIAPTGVGKTVLGQVFSLFYAKNGKRSYILVPTSLLAQQITDRIVAFSKKLGLNVRIVSYHGGMTQKEKKDAIQKIRDRNFEILVTTDRFIVSNFELLRGLTFDFIFVDDIDSFLRSSRNVDKILLLLGFSPEIIDSAFDLLESRRKREKERVDELERKIREFKRNNNVGLLVVSGATMKARRTKRIRLFEILLDFEMGFKPEFLRNIKDFYLCTKGEVKEFVLQLLQKFGPGCLLFVPQKFGKDEAEELHRYLLRNGIKSEIYKKPSRKILSKFEQKELDVLIGIATFRNPLARGIDLPETVRYVVFTGVPRIEISLTLEECNPIKLLTILNHLRDFLQNKYRERAEILSMQLKKISPLNEELMNQVRQAIQEDSELEGFAAHVKRVIKSAIDFLQEVLTPELITKLQESPDISIGRSEGGELYLIVPDPVAYLQGSGRASRMFAGGISRGASILLVDDEKAFRSLIRRLKQISGEEEWEEYNEEKVREWLKLVDQDRELIRRIRRGELIADIQDYIKSALLIVESPTKARTIARFFGRPQKRILGDVTILEVSTGPFLLNIVPSMGHLYDLVTNEGIYGVQKTEQGFIPIYDFIKTCKQCKEQFTDSEACPKCGSTEYFSKERIVSALQQLALEVNLILIATDPDAEGEKIAYDLYCSLYPLNSNIRRIELHEITKRAFLRALQNMREINLKLVEAQIFRRIEDRWIGFELSQKLWKKFESRRLSAGRVQTPVLGWVIERTRLSRRKRKLLKLTLPNGLQVILENPKISSGAKEVNAKVETIEFQTRKINPPPPYTTDALLKDASSKLGFSTSQAMRLAQDLFEAGLCTYHRTDSTSVSTVGVELAKDYITAHFPAEMFVPRRYTQKGAHECIRPTRPLDVTRLRHLLRVGLLRFAVKLTSDHFRLYDLIFRRFIASQMKETEVMYQKIRVTVNGSETSVEQPVEITSSGFDRILPIRVRNRVADGTYAVEATIARLPLAPLFTEGDLVGLMKVKGIGRPSTYARIIATLSERGYVFYKKNKILSTSLGQKVFEYLKEKFDPYISEDATKNLQQLMDQIEQGEVNYQPAIERLYKELLLIKQTN